MSDRGRHKFCLEAEIWRMLLAAHSWSTSSSQRPQRHCHRPRTRTAAIAPLWLWTKHSLRQSSCVPPANSQYLQSGFFVFCFDKAADGCAATNGRLSDHRRALAPSIDLTSHLAIATSNPLPAASPSCLDEDKGGSDPFIIATADDSSGRNASASTTVQRSASAVRGRNTGRFAAVALTRQ